MNCQKTTTITREITFYDINEENNEIKGSFYFKENIYNFIKNNFNIDIDDLDNRKCGDCYYVLSKLYQKGCSHKNINIQKESLDLLNNITAYCYNNHKYYFRINKIEE